MPECIRESFVHARKMHTCDFCENPIRKGELHSYSFLKDGEVYNWRSHLECKFIARELHEYIDPWDGMTSDDFIEGVDEFCQTFICPTCKGYDSESEECADDERYCLWKVGELLKKYSLIDTGKRTIGHRFFKLEPREVTFENYESVFGVDE